MRKISVFLIIQLIIGFTVYGQGLEINWGHEFDSNTDVQKILGVTKDKLVAYTLKGKKRFIETYDRNGFKLDNTAEYELPEIENLQSGLLNITLSKDNVAALLYIYNKKERSFGLFSQTLTITGKPIGKPLELYNSGESDDKIKDSRVDVVFSPDNTKALVYFDRKDTDRTEFYSDVIVLDLSNGVNIESEKKFVFPIRNSKSENIDFRAFHSIENDGTYGLIQEKLETEKMKIVDFRLSVGRYTNKGEKIGETELSEAGKILLSPTMLTKNGVTYVVGYFMNNSKGRTYVAGYSGLFMAVLDDEVQQESMKFNEFSDDFLLNIYSGKKVEKAADKGKELKVPAPYTMDEIFIHEDGTFTVLSEYYLVTVTVDKGAKTTTTNYGNILYFKLDDNGELIAADAIKKNQISSTSSIGLGVGSAAGSFGLGMFISIELPDNRAKYWSYTSTMNDGDIYLVFNDHFKNANDGEDDLSKPMVAPKKSVPFLVTISQNGTFVKEAMVSSGDSETYLVPQVTYPISNSEFIIWGIYRKLNKFGLAKIK